LPALVSLLNSTEGQRKVLKNLLLRLVETKLTEKDAQATLSPGELWMAIMTMDESVGLKKLLEVVQILVNTPTMMKQDLLAVLLQQLCELPKLPSLFMRVVGSALCCIM